MKMNFSLSIVKQTAFVYVYLKKKRIKVNKKRIIR